MIPKLITLRQRNSSFKYWFYKVSSKLWLNSPLSDLCSFYCVWQYAYACDLPWLIICIYILPLFQNIWSILNFWSQFENSILIWINWVLDNTIIKIANYLIINTNYKVYYCQNLNKLLQILNLKISQVDFYEV